MWHGVRTTDNTTHGRPVSADSAHGNPHGNWFKVWEADCSNYGGCHPWFYGGDNPQSLPLMMSHWESVYGRGQNYILNLPPSPDGIITPKMAAAAAAFGAERHRRYGAGSSNPTAPSECELARTGGRLAQWSTAGSLDSGGGGGNGTATDDTKQAPPATELVLHFDSVTYFDRIFLSEDVANDGQLIAQYAVDVCNSSTSAAGAPNAAAGGCNPGSTAGWVKLVVANGAGGP